MVVGILGLALAVAAHILTTAAQMHYVNLGVNLFVTVLIAVFAIYQSRTLEASGATPSQVGSLNARHMGTVWAYGAIAMTAVYSNGIIEWREWWQFVLAFGLAGILSYVFALLLKTRGEDDARLFRLSRWLAVVQLIGMIAVVFGLFIDGKLDTLGVSPWGPRSNPPNDWSANNVFIAGAVALGAMSWVALGAGSRAQRAEVARTAASAGGRDAT